jgi:hypothetical protein
MRQVPHLEGVTGQECRMREICYLYLTRFLPILLDREDRMSMAAGLEVPGQRGTGARPELLAVHASCGPGDLAIARRLDPVP